MSISQFVPDAVFPFLSFSHFCSGVQVEKAHVSHWRVFISENFNHKGRGLAEAASKAHKSLAATWYLNLSESARSSRLLQALPKTVFQSF